MPREGTIAVTNADLYYRDLGQGQPVVILHGEQDFCPVACAAHIAGAIPGARLVVLATHNTDISDSWEREGEDPGFFYQFSPNGYALGINVLLYAMTH